MDEETLRSGRHHGGRRLGPQRGVVVTRMTPDRTMEMFETTAEFEASRLGLATYQTPPLELSAHMDLHEQSASAVVA